MPPMGTGEIPRTPPVAPRSSPDGGRSQTPRKRPERREAEAPSPEDEEPRPGLPEDRGEPDTGEDGPHIDIRV